MTSEDEAKQLDSVTDRVLEQELDESRATQALGALNGTNAAAGAARGSAFVARKEDVAIIMEELEVTEDEAVAALRAAAAEVGGGEDGNLPGGDSLVAAALRRLVLS